jgi:plastocyanin
MATATVTWGESTYETVYTSYAGTPEPTPAVTPQDHRIVVGADGQLSYNPANITAAINDTVTFEFRPKNHTVTQSTFSNPCEGKPDGFRSGFRPIAADSADASTFTIKINDVRTLSQILSSLSILTRVSIVDRAHLGLLWTDRSLPGWDGLLYQRR